MMESASARKAKWILDQEALDRFLNRLDSDRERAGEQYERIRQKLTSFFRARGRWDAEDLVDEAIDRVIRRLDEIRELKAFPLGVARTLFLEVCQRDKQAREVSLEDSRELRQPAGVDPDDEREVDRRLRCLDRCVPLLDPNDRELIMQWYIYDKGQKIENKERLAELRRASRGTLRVQACRARKRLRKLVDECLAESRTA